MLELAVLGILAEQPLHGYELKKRLSETLGPLWGISFGSLYPALRRLERDGSIVQTGAVETGAAAFVPTGSLDGDLAAARRRARPRPSRRTKKAYTITDAGREAFTRLLETDEPDDERTFALKLSFCRYMTTDARLEFLGRRRSELAQRLSKSRRTPTTRTIDRYTRSLLEHRAASTQHEIQWIDELIAEERANQIAERTEGAASA
ncbi:MAG TPA: PadR family transcriptional regulator [Acidimicrobiia bacterium]|nr:PadR family transcriptional regulator [Acidimicrobiia bacterium]